MGDREKLRWPKNGEDRVIHTDQLPLQGLESCPISIGRNHEGERKAENPEGILKDFQGTGWGLPGT